jgi:YHS domain-containing protein
MKKIIFCLLFFVFFQNGFAKDRVFSSFLGVAIGGYDPVAYFLESMPVEGNKSFSYEWEGATWRFSSQENLELFRANPQKYAPQYGGFCAYAMAQGAFASTKPEAWSIVGGRLFLNYDLSIRKKWSGNQTYYIQFADNKWDAIWRGK